MENILGIILFILFIVVRSMGDRRRGMSKNTVSKRKTVIETKKTAAKEEYPPEKRLTAPYLEEQEKKKSPLKPALEPVKPLRKTSSFLAEGESSYDELSYMEGVEPEPGKGKEAVQDIPPVFPAVGGQNYVLTNNELRNAVIWSEILQKPRFRTRLTRYSR